MATSSSSIPNASVESRSLTCLEGDSLAPEDENSAVYALILRADRDTRVTVLSIVKEMPDEDMSVLGGIVAAAAKARTGRVAVDSLQIASVLFAENDGTPEQRRRAFEVVDGGE